MLGPEIGDSQRAREPFVDEPCHQPFIPDENIHAKQIDIYEAKSSGERDQYEKQ
jgi:hypothetical protein